MNRNAIYRACAIALGLSPLALAADPTWNTPTGNWATPTNWSTATAPAPGDNAVVFARSFTNGGFGDASVNFNATYANPIASLKITALGTNIVTPFSAEVVQTDPASALLVDWLNMPGSFDGHAQYTLGAGKVSAGSLTMASDTRGGAVWQQNGGTFTAQTVTLKDGHSGSSSGSVAFNQTGGTSHTNRLETIERIPGSINSASISLSGGTLSTDTLAMSNNDWFRWTGGTLNVSAIELGTSTIELAQGVGTLRADTLSGTGAIVMRDNGVILDSGSRETVRGFNFIAPAGLVKGYVRASDIFTSFPADWQGEQVDADAVLIRGVLAGDANMDGTVNLLDFNRLASNFNQPNRFWFDGDFDYDGNVNLSDFNLLAANFNHTETLPSAVPEPSVAFVLGALVLARIRSRAAQAHVAG